MRNLLLVSTLAIGTLGLSACSGLTVQGATERVIATKEIATATINAVCSRPEDDVVRVDIRKALSKISSVDSRIICTDGLDVYLSNLVNSRIQGPVTTVQVQ